MPFSRNKPSLSAGRRQLVFCLLLLTGAGHSFGQQTQQVNPQFARGNFINDVRILIRQDSSEVTANAQQMADFYNAFFIRPGTTFNPVLTDLAIQQITRRETVRSAYYELYEAKTGSGTLNRPLSIIIYVTLATSGPDGVQPDDPGSKQPMGIPPLVQSKSAQVKFFLNGGLGVYNDVNALFGQGDAFAQGNPVADNPAGEGTQFWLETFAEPGLSGITRLGKSSAYLYGEASVLASVRNTTDIYSTGGTAYVAVERLYAGLLLTSLGANRDITVNVNYGRNFYQLNDGFLFAKPSGSANAGERGGVYSSPRTALQKNGTVALSWKRLRLSAHFLEPQELFKDRQLNTSYVVGTLDYNDNKTLDLGISYISTAGGRATYAVPEGTIAKQGMYIINPKLWLTNIAQTGLFFKSEFAYQTHHTAKMKSYAWYTGLGYVARKLKTTPSLYYRYAFMSGDNPNTTTYERFDPILTGVLGNWVQGLNFRKLLGNGNIVSNRVELTSWLTPSMSLSLDYFYLRSDQLTNLGGLPPITTLKSKELGHEASLTLKGLVKGHYTLLGVVSYSVPGKGIRESFANHVPNWLTAQAAVFIGF